jgi:hypothetical protein
MVWTAGLWGFFMLTRFRRFLLLGSVVVWQGGFVFYAGVVVPTGGELHGHFGQGLVTQRVTHWLNLFGLVCHVAYFWELMATKGPRFLGAAAPRVRWWKWSLWGASLAMLNALAFVHMRMDWLIDAGARTTGDGFRGWHIAYLWLSTAQWLIAAVLGWATVGPPSRRADSPPL